MAFRELIDEPLEIIEDFVLEKEERLKDDDRELLVKEISTYINILVSSEVDSIKEFHQFIWEVNEFPSNDDTSTERRKELEHWKQTYDLLQSIYKKYEGEYYRDRKSLFPNLRYYWRLTDVVPWDPPKEVEADYIKCLFMLEHDIGTASKIYHTIYNDTIISVHSTIVRSETSGKSLIESILRKIDNHFESQRFEEWWNKEIESEIEESDDEIDDEMIDKYFEDPNQVPEEIKKRIFERVEANIKSDNIEYVQATRNFIMDLLDIYKDLHGSQFQFQNSLLRELDSNEPEISSNTLLEKVKNPQVIMFLYIAAKKEGYNFNDAMSRNLFAEEVFKIYQGENAGNEENPQSKYYTALSDFIKGQGGIGKRTIKGYLRPSSVFELVDRPHINYSDLSKKLLAINSLLPSDDLSLESEITKLKDQGKEFLSDIDSKSKLAN